MARTDDDRALRAQARAGWPGKVTTLGDEDDAALVRAGTPGQRVAMVWRITLDAWASTGKSLPVYTRATMPGQVIRGGDG